MVIPNEVIVAMASGWGVSMLDFALRQRLLQLPHAFVG
jgi:hypothetical protein